MKNKEIPEDIIPEDIKELLSKRSKNHKKTIKKGRELFNQAIERIENLEELLNSPEIGSFLESAEKKNGCFYFHSDSDYNYYIESKNVGWVIVFEEKGEDEKYAYRKYSVEYNLISRMEDLQKSPEEFSYATEFFKHMLGLKENQIFEAIRNYKKNENR